MTVAGVSGFRFCTVVLLSCASLRTMLNNTDVRLPLVSSLLVDIPAVIVESLAVASDRIKLLAFLLKLMMVCR